MFTFLLKIHSLNFYTRFIALPCNTRISKGKYSTITEILKFHRGKSMNRDVKVFFFNFVFHIFFTNLKTSVTQGCLSLHNITLLCFC